MRKRISSLLVVIMMLFNLLTIYVYASNYNSDWRLVARTTQISFRDEQGALIPELSNLWINDSSLSYDSSTVSYGELENQDYNSFDFSFSCVDYNYMVYSDGSNLPNTEQILAELSFGKETLEPNRVTCTVTSKGYLQLNFLFEDVNFFDGENKEAEVYIQYRKKSIDGDETSDFYKGDLTISFDSLRLPNTPTETPDNEPLKVEVLLPQTESKVEAEKPYILIEQCSIMDGRETITAGSCFDIELRAANIDTLLDVENVLMQVDTPDSLRLLDSSNTYYIGNVPKGETFSKILSFETLANAKSQYCVITVKFSYEYLDGKDRKQESISQKFVVSLEEEVAPIYEEDEADIDAEKPYILIEECNIGNGLEFVSADSQFDVQLLAKNLHSYLDTENVLMQVDVPDGLRLLNPSNTFYIGDVQDGESVAETLRFQVMGNVQSKDCQVGILFTYEYVDDDSRKDGSIHQEIVIPLRQPSRFTVDELNLRPEYVVGEKQNFYSGYANMGKVKLYNVTAALQTDLLCDVKVYHLGNLEAGEGGLTEFTVFCEKIGVYPIEIMYSYETESGQYQEEMVRGELNYVLPEGEIEEEPVIQYITEFPSPAQTVGKVSIDTVILLILSALGLVMVVVMIKKQN